MSAYLDIAELSIALRADQSRRLLRGVSLSVAPGEVRGLVGESGAGKTMIGRTIFDILPRAAAVAGGSVRLGGSDLLAMRPRERRKLIARTSALIPQDPLTALNPVRRIDGQITDRLTAILGLSRAAARERALQLLKEVHIADPERVLASYPHQLSGGMRQRVLIASAFAAEPKLIVADEPTTALDVMIQAQILELLGGIARDFGMGIILVTHDLGVVAQVCDRVVVMYGGIVAEENDAATLFRDPQHPYTQQLLGSFPDVAHPDRALRGIPGTPPR
ncbi:MAG: ABC transporter ATP-binding protein, partial [Propylenella sp.]